MKTWHYFLAPGLEDLFKYYWVLSDQLGSGPDFALMIGILKFPVILIIMINLDGSHSYQQQISDPYNMGRINSKKQYDDKFSENKK